MTRSKAAGIALFVTAIATAACYFWVDRSVAIWSHENLHGYVIFANMTVFTGWFPPIAIATICLGGLVEYLGYNIPRWGEAALSSSVSLIVARAAKDQLKILFGRTWPETWVNNNPSLIADGTFGFHLFHTGPGFESFPSGHTTAICAVAATLWIYYPRLGALYLLPVLVVSVGLIGANYHFVSDILAGSFIGTSIAIFCTALFSKHDRQLECPTNKTR
jgi:membrane-associated phospholipid phosphatase